MQGVLGIANTSGEPSVYWQGVMDRDGTAFTDDVPSGAPYTDRPAYAGAKLYLYNRGSAATFDGLSVSGVTVKGGADATEYVLRPMPVSNDEDTSVLHPDVFRAENDDFRVTVGTPAKDTTSAFTYRPLTVKGRSQGQITLTVTLTDAENHAFTLSIPYTLTEEDTRVTATLRVDEQAFTLSVPYGTGGRSPVPAAGGPQHPRGRYQLDAGHHPAAVCRHGLHRRAQNGGQRRRPHRPGRRYPRFRQQGPGGHALRRSIRTGQQQLRHRSHARAVTGHPSMTHRRKEALPCTN